MATGDITQGRRVNGGVSALEQPGDYSPFFNRDGELAGVWLILPNGNWGRLPNEGHGKRPEAEWKVTVHDDGTVSVEPSIDSHGATPEQRWHGYLERGVFREV